jgi:hypothetical protein
MVTSSLNETSKVKKVVERGGVTPPAPIPFYCTADFWRDIYRRREQVLLRLRYFLHDGSVQYLTTLYLADFNRILKRA